MAKPTQNAPVLLTANDLLSGEIVYWTGAAWSPSAAFAKTARGDDAAALKHVGATEEAAQIVVGANLVTLDPITLRPIALRERQRMDGPSIAYAPNA
ncbi:MAG: DUF2849 domain-containing protein [Pseudomonadota bacterium]